MANLSEQKRELIELLMQCPASNDNPGDCPLCDIRKMSHLQQVEWLGEQSSDDVQNILTYHKNCYSKKLATMSLSHYSD